MRSGTIVAAKAICTGGLVLLATRPSLILVAATTDAGDQMLRFTALAFASLAHLFIMAGIGVAGGIWLGAARF